jgi:hypothetical protein
VLPDFFKPNVLEISRISVDGIERTTLDPDNFRVELDDDEDHNNIEEEIVVEFSPVVAKDK